MILASKNDADFDLTEVNHIILRAMDTDSTATDYLLGEKILIDVITCEYFDKYIELTKKGVTHFNNHLKTIINS